MSTRECDRWKRQRESGKWYIAMKTAISFGAAMFLLDAILYWAYPASHSEFPFPRVFIWPIAGFLMGLSGWWAKEARYNNTILENKIHDGLRLK
jgi:hypothetical protein